MDSSKTFGGFELGPIHHRAHKHVYYAFNCPVCGYQMITTMDKMKKKMAKGKATCPVCHTLPPPTQSYDTNFPWDVPTIPTITHSTNDTNDTINIKSINFHDTNDTDVGKSNKDNKPLITPLTKDGNGVDTNTAPTTKYCDDEGPFTDFDCDNVEFTFINGDLFKQTPPWYYIAHCIPADMTFGGATARKVDYYWNMRHRLIYDYDAIDLEVGDCILVENVFNLIASPAKYTKATMEGLTECVRRLARDCRLYNVRYLAMPKIGCGSNGLDWAEVLKMITEVFYKEFILTDNQIFIRIFDNIFVDATDTTNGLVQIG